MATRRLSEAARGFIARKIRIGRREGIPMKQAVGRAFGMARSAGYRVPQPHNPITEGHPSLVRHPSVFDTSYINPEPQDAQFDTLMNPKTAKAMLLRKLARPYRFPLTDDHPFSRPRNLLDSMRWDAQQIVRERPMLSETA